MLRSNLAPDYNYLLQKIKSLYPSELVSPTAEAATIHAVTRYNACVYQIKIVMAWLLFMEPLMIPYGVLSESSVSPHEILSKSFGGQNAQNQDD